MANLSHRWRYINELEEQDIIVSFHPDVILDRMIILVRKGPVEFREAMPMPRYYDDVYYDNTLRKLVRKVENAFAEVGK